MAICEVAKEDAASALKRAERQVERKREQDRDGDILAVSQKEEAAVNVEKQKELAFAKLWNLHSTWASSALDDAVAFARENEPRSSDSKDGQEAEIERVFYGSLWDSLQGRGWREEEIDGAKVYKFENHTVSARKCEQSPRS